MPEGPLGEHLFTFAVVTDSHVNEAEDRSVSPYASNRLANGRFRYVVRALNRHHPAFTVHLGDLVNPLPELETYEPAAENFKAIAAELRSPLHLLPGNHCVGDKPVGWVPVPRVSEVSLDRFERLFGPQYFSFDRGPCHFAALDSLLVNSGFERERAQRAWLEEDLKRAAGAGQRIFALMHYPPFVTSSDELGSYDNLDEPGRSWLLELLERHRVEAVYSGHVHNYFYNRHAGTDLYTLPATSFVRQDYADVFRAPPEDGEGGRDDGAKLGYCLVKVYERGHVNHLVRTHGRTLAPDEQLPHPDVEAPHAREGELAPLGVELRENWLARAALRPNNSVSPFTRREARNDWALLALEEMGISRVRLSLQELVKEDVVERLRPLGELGYVFTVYSHGLPEDEDYRTVRRHRRLLAAWELILRPEDLEQAAGGLAKLARSLPTDDMLPCYLSEIRDISRAAVDDANVKHEANYGFQPGEVERISELCRSAPIRETFAGLVFRLRRRGGPLASPWEAVREIGRLGRTSGMRHQLHALFSGNLTADRLVDDLDTAGRVAECAFAAALQGNVDVVFDTFEDVDRGYFVRNGLVDGRYNPRLAARVLRRLNAALYRHPGAGAVEGVVRELPGGRVLAARRADHLFVLVLPSAPFELRSIEVPAGAPCEELTTVDLADGATATISVESDGPCLRLSSALAVETPHLALAALER